MAESRPVCWRSSASQRKESQSLQTDMPEKESKKFIAGVSDSNDTALTNIIPKWTANWYLKYLVLSLT